MHHQSCSWGPDNRFCDSWGREPSGLDGILRRSAQQNGNWIDFKPEFEPEFQIWTAKEAKRRQFFYVIIDVSMYRVDKSRRVSRLVSRHSQTTLFHLLPPLKALLGTTSIRQSTTKSTNDSNDNRFAPDRLRIGRVSYSWATAELHLAYHWATCNSSSRSTLLHLQTVVTSCDRLLPVVTDCYL